MRVAKFFCAFLLAIGILITPAPSQAAVDVAISVRIGPPVLPVYVQPVCPEPGFIWMPGYWAYGPYGYFWVPGTWVLAPELGLLWTPGYWAFNDGFYIWNEGYWGPVVGFYGGINYGFGYPGTGFFGGYWRSGTYFYNRAVTNVNVTVVKNTYHTVVNESASGSRVSFNGRSGGTTARPTATEIAAARQRRSAPTSEQLRQKEAAQNDRSFLASVNHGQPQVAASSRPAEFRGRKTETRQASPTEPSPGRVTPDVQRKQQREPAQPSQPQDTKPQQRQRQEQPKLERQTPNAERQQQPQERRQEQAPRVVPKPGQLEQPLQENQPGSNPQNDKKPEQQKQPHGHGKP